MSAYINPDNQQNLQMIYRIVSTAFIGDATSAIRVCCRRGAVRAVAEELVDDDDDEDDGNNDDNDDDDETKKWSSPCSR